MVKQQRLRRTRYTYWKNRWFHAKLTAIVILLVILVQALPTTFKILKRKSSSMISLASHKATIKLYSYLSANPSNTLSLLNTIRSAPPASVEAKAFSVPPGENGRKITTQRN